MFLKNYYKILAYDITGDSSVKVKTTDGAETTTPSSSQYKIRQSISFQTSYSVGASNGIVLGTGSTPPTLDDYVLSGSVISGLTATMTSARTSDSDSSAVTFTITLTNNNANDVTASEIGIYSNVGKCALVERTLLDSPVTIPAGGIGQITYTVRMDYPTA